MNSLKRGKRLSTPVEPGRTAPLDSVPQAEEKKIIQMALDERERSDHFRLKLVKKLSRGKLEMKTGEQALAACSPVY